MNGAQDLGGMMGFGPVQAEPDEPWFHADWEKRAFGITLRFLRLRLSNRESCLRFVEHQFGHLGLNGRDGHHAAGSAVLLVVDEDDHEVAIIERH